MWNIMLASDIYACVRLPYLGGLKQSKFVLLF